MSVETLQVVDVLDLKLPEDIYDSIADHYEIYNGSYHRYYPDDNWDYIKKEYKDVINQKLLEIGVTFPEVMYRDVYHPDGYYNFKVLLYFSW